jgi:hypothetical protein
MTTATNPTIPSHRIGDSDYSKLYQVRYTGQFGKTRKFFWGRNLTAAMNCAIVHDGEIEVVSWKKGLKIENPSIVRTPVDSNAGCW